MPTTVRDIADISIPGASRTNGHLDRAIHDKFSGLAHAVFTTDRSAVSGGVSLLRSGRRAGDFRDGRPDFLATISAHQTTLLVGAFLMLLNTVVDVGKGVLFFPILENHGKRRAMAYLAFIVVQVVLLDIGVVGLLTIAPLGQLAAGAGQASAPWAQTFGSLLIQWNNMAYSIGEATLGVGGLFLCSLLFTTRLIPGSWRLAASSAT